MLFLCICVDEEVELFMLRRFIVVVAIGLSIGPSAFASIFDAPKTGESSWAELMLKAFTVELITQIVSLV